MQLFGQIAHTKAKSEPSTMTSATKEKLELSSEAPGKSDEELDRIVAETSAALALTYNRKSTSAREQANADKRSSASEPLNRLLQPKRPMNAFMVWGQSIRRELHNRYTNVQNAMLSKALGRVWKRLNLEEKRPYIEHANTIKANHKRDYPNYRYQPRRIQEKQIRQQLEASHCAFMQQQQQQQQQQQLGNATAPPVEQTSTSVGYRQAGGSLSSSSASTSSTTDGQLGQSDAFQTYATHGYQVQYLDQSPAFESHQADSAYGRLQQQQQTVTLDEKGYSIQDELGQYHDLVETPAAYQQHQTPFDYHQHQQLLQTREDTNSSSSTSTTAGVATTTTNMYWQIKSEPSQADHGMCPVHLCE